nr:hypothetical protein [Pinus koraiensis]
MQLCGSSPSSQGKNECAFFLQDSHYLRHKHSRWASPFSGGSSPSAQAKNECAFVLQDSHYPRHKHSWGSSVIRKHVVESLPPLDMSQ